MNVKLMKNVLKGKENGNRCQEKTELMITCFVMVSIEGAQQIKEK